MEIVALIISIFSLAVTFIFSLFTFNANHVDKLNDHITEIDTIIINHPELLYIYNDDEIEKRKDDSSFINKMKAFIFLNFNIFENVYLQHLSKRTLFSKYRNTWDKFIVSIFKTKLVNEIWEQNLEFYDKRFTKYVDKLIRKKYSTKRKGVKYE
jgi:hypothetical protein